MSDIFGFGHGSHYWQRLDTTPQKRTRYRCRDCGLLFTHAYDLEPSIFDALEKEHVSQECRVDDELRAPGSDGAREDSGDG